MQHETPGDTPADSPPAINPAPDLCPQYCLGLYEIALCYGGPEEGGWWYSWEDHKASVIIPAGSEAEQETAEAAARAALTETAERLGLILPGPGVRSYRSAAPQQTAIIQTEDIPGEHQSTERPFYE